MTRSLAVVLCAFSLLANPVLAQSTPETPQEDPQTQAQPEPDMTMQRLAQIVFAIDEEAVASGSSIQFTIEDIPVLIVADPVADRMRAMVPIRSAQELSSDDMMRMMQSNFDAALDARYAVAQGRLWGVFIHPLSPLRKDQLLSGIAQTVSIARTYGTVYSGGAVTYGGGDSNQIYRNLFEELQKKGEEI